MKAFKLFLVKIDIFWDVCDIANMDKHLSTLYAQVEVLLLLFPHLLYHCYHNIFIHIALH